MEPSSTLICIPDISGFTRFMTKVDFKLGFKVIPSLLNNIIYSNEIGLKISEIEGDAVLFYRQGALPSLKTLIEQCKYFYNEFYVHLEELRKTNGDSKNAARIPQILGLKIVLHFGEEVAHVPIGNHIKLIGEDIIAAHRLLKNEVPVEEYILLSEELLNQYRKDVDALVDWTEISESSILDEHIGEVPFHYVPLAPLKYE